MAIRQTHLTLVNQSERCSEQPKIDGLPMFIMQYKWQISWYGDEGDEEEGYDYVLIMTTSEGVEIRLCAIKEMGNPNGFAADLETFRKGKGKTPVNLSFGNVTFTRKGEQVSIEADPGDDNISYLQVNALPYDPSMCDALSAMAEHRTSHF